MMKSFKYGVPVLAAACVSLLPLSGRAESISRGEAQRNTIQAKIEYCTTCHGSSGQGYRGFYTMPRLAGQQPEYFVNQLDAFADHRRENRFMYGIARSLSPQILLPLAAHFRRLDPAPLGGGAKHLVAAGKKIYEEGIPENNVPACMACHGEDAKGKGEIPRLAGQLPDYIFDKLTNWERERGRGRAGGADVSALMLPTSHALTRSQIAEVAAYVSSRR